MSEGDEGEVSPLSHTELDEHWGVDQKMAKRKTRETMGDQLQALAPDPDGDDNFTSAVHAINSMKDRQTEDRVTLTAIRDQQVTDGVTLTSIENKLTAIREQQIADGGTLVAIQNQLAALNAALGGGISIPQRQAMAISCNNHDNDRRQYVPVPTDAGIVPPHWPVGLSRSHLRRLTVPAMNLLLTDFGLNTGGNAADKRNRLAEHIGTARRF